MTVTAYEVWIGVAALLFMTLFCVWIRWCTSRISKLLVPWTGLQRSMPRRSITQLLGMFLYGIPGITIYLILSLVKPELVTPIRFSFSGLLAGMLLGLGLAAAASTVARGMILLITPFLRSGNRKEKPFEEFEGIGDTGWFRGLSFARKIWPRGGYLLAAGTIVGEEMLYRGVALPMLAIALGPVAAVVLATLGHMTTQAIGMPSLYIALVPISGALIIGIVQGYLAIVSPDIFPLIVAHFTFFVILVFAVPVQEDQKFSKQVTRL